MDKSEQIEVFGNIHDNCCKISYQLYVHLPTRSTKSCHIFVRVLSSHMLTIWHIFSLQE